MIPLHPVAVDLYRCLSPENEMTRKQQIMEILGRGNIVVFTKGNLVKKIDRWEGDPDGDPGSCDLKCCWINGLSQWVCWVASDYVVSEELSAQK